MTEQVHVSLELELFVDDRDALKQAAHERMRSAWRSTSGEDFPFQDASDVPFEQAVQSLIADALPLTLPGARRSQLLVEIDKPEDNRREEPEEDNGREEPEA